MDYVVLNPVFNQWEKPPIRYKYKRVGDRWEVTEVYENRLYGYVPDDLIKLCITLG